MTLSERVKLARGKRGLSQRELAEKTGHSGGYISMLEKAPGEPNAVASPGLDSLEKLADALVVPRSWLILGEGPEPDWAASSEPTTGGDEQGSAA